MLLPLFALATTSVAQAEPFTLADPQFRAGVHASTPDDNDQAVVHVVFANLVSSTTAFAYMGWKHKLDEHWSLELLAGTPLASSGLSPIVSTHIERAGGRLYLWGDLEYTPLAEHNVYTYVTAAYAVGSLTVGVDTEDWVNLATPDSTYVSAGPAAGALFGDHVYLGATALVTNEGQIIPRTYLHLFL